ncbi:MAG TPA: response regulator [Candidatus Saccharimonadales bacterium]|nr:response regulator [Candidatus Saccharimonadales bacterium]
MVVDDEIDIINLLKLILEAEGYEIVTAVSGDKALELAEIETPDLVLLDLMMPGKSGLETCKCFKARPRTRNTPVIIFSALGREVDKKLTTEAGASAHITKPFNNIGLLTEVKRCLNEVRGWKFSKQLGIEHSKLVGKKILLEFDPTTDYERLVRDFVSECTFLEEGVIIVTRKGSRVRQALEGDEGAKFTELERASELLPVLKSNSEGPLTFVIDSLSDLVLNRDSNGTLPISVQTFIQTALETLDEPRITAVFLINPTAHDPKEVATVQGAFSHQLIYEKSGVTVARFG